MPGNEIPQNIHNFFEQGNSTQGCQSQIAGEGWPILNNNPWVGTQGHNGAPLSFNSKNFTPHQVSDSEQGNGIQHLQTSFGSNPSQKAELIRSQPRNQHLNLNGHIYASQGFQGRSIQAGVHGDGHSLMHGDFSTFESQQSNVNSAERPDATEAPVNFDFLGGQHQLRGQHPGNSQPHPIEPLRVTDMQLWQQHLLYKQLKEMMRQQQLLQLQQGVRQPNSFGQLSDIGTQASSDQISSVLSGMPINSMSNNILSNELVGGKIKLPNSPTMFLPGDANSIQRSSMQGFPNGPMFTHSQGQGMQTRGLGGQLPDQSLHATPVASTRVSFKAMRGADHDFSATQGDIGSNANKSEETSMLSPTFKYFLSDQSAVPREGYLHDGVTLEKEGFQGRSLLHAAAIPGVSHDAMSEKFQETTPVSPSVQVRKMSGMLHEKAGEHMGAPQGMSNLNLTEQKLSFSIDDDAVSFGVNSDKSLTGLPEGNAMQNDYFTSFPTLNSGSWSALMQEAVEASTSEPGLNEEWSGFSSQKTELSFGNHSAMLHDKYGKQQATWDGQTLQTASSLTSRLLLFDDVSGSTSCRVSPNFQTSMNFSPQQTQGPSAGALHGSFQQSSEEDTMKPFDQNHQTTGGSVQSQTQFDNFSKGIWAGKTREQPAISAHFSQAEFSSVNMQHSGAHQQKMSLHSRSDVKQNDWSSRSFESNTSSYDNGDGRHVLGNNTKTTMHTTGTYIDPSLPSSAARQEPVGSDISSLMRKKDSQIGDPDTVKNSNNISLNQGMIQQPPSSHQVDYGNHDRGRYQNQLGGSSQPWDSSMHNSNRRSSEPSSHKHENRYPEDGLNEGFISSNSQPCHNPESGSSAGESSFLAGNESQSLVSSFKSSSQSSQKNVGPRRFLFHPMGNLEMSTGHVDSRSRTSSSQASPLLKNQEHGYIGHSDYTGFDNAPEARKGYPSDFQRNEKAAEGIKHKGALLNHSDTPPFDGSTSQFSEGENKSTGFKSQNMLEFPHMVDQSKAGETAECVSSSEQNILSGRHEQDNFHGSSHLQICQSPSFQGFGLKLAPPTQRQSGLNHALPSQISSEPVGDFSRRKLESGTGEDPSRPPPSASIQHQKENQSDKSSLSGDKNKDAVFPNFRGKPLAAAAYNFKMNQSLLQQRQQEQQLQWQQLQEQQQRFSSATAPIPNAKLVGAHPVDVDTMKSLQHGNRQESLAGTMRDQSSETSVPSAAGRLPPSKLTSSADTCVSSASQFFPGDAGHSEPRNSSSHLRSSGQEISGAEMRSVGHPPPKSPMSQPGGFSTMLHNVWTSVSSRQRLSGIQPQRVITNVLQSRSPLSCRRNSLQGPQKPDNQNKRKGESTSSEFGSCSPSSKEVKNGNDCALKDNAFQEMPPTADTDLKAGSSLSVPIPESDLKGHSDGNVSTSFSVQLRQQDFKKKHAHESIDAHEGQISLSSFASSNCDTGTHGKLLESSDVHKQNNSSLLQQRHAVNGGYTDPAQRAGKRLKGAESSVDAMQMDGGGGESYVYGQNTVLRETAATSQNISFPSDPRILSFSSRDDKEHNTKTPLQAFGGGVSSHDLLTYKPHDFQSQSHTQGKTPNASFGGGRKYPHISPQMAPSWFEKYGNHRNGQILTTYGGFGSLQRNTKPSSENYAFSKVSENMVCHVAPERKDDATLAGHPEQSASSPVAIVSGYSAPSHTSLEDTNNSVILVPKKRKTATADLLPWHKELTQGRRRLQSISIMEQKWAWAVNRLTEKVEEGLEMVENSVAMARSRRRLIAPSQLMQQILPPVAARYLSGGAATSYESLLYSMAKLILGDACSMNSCLESDSRVDSDNGNMISGTLNKSEKEGSNHFSRFVEDFFGRLRRLENDLLRLGKRASILDVRLECQELERHSIVNRFAKFHGRTPNEGVEGSSMSENAPRRSFPQRRVIAHALPRDLPEGVICMSL